MGSIREKVPVRLRPMLNLRRAAKWGVLLVVGVAFAGGVGFWAYLGSDHYRRRVQAGLADFFGLPTDVGGIRPVGVYDRELSGVQIWLPQRRARIFSCPRTVWDVNARDLPDGATAIHVHDGFLSIGSSEWDFEDYERVLRASLAHNFQQLGIQQVRFHNTRIVWPRGNFQLAAGGVNGKVVFDDDNNNGGGHAELTAGSLNGVSVNEPIRISAELDPQNSEALISEVTLDVPALPLNALGLEQVLQSRITQGLFAGKITYRQLASGQEIEAAGYVSDVRLDQLTKLIPGGPVPAIVDLKIDRARIRDRNSIEVVFSGRLRDLQVDPILSRYNLPAIGGTINLTVGSGQFVDGVLRHLSAKGQWVGGSLETLTETLLDGVRLPGNLLLRVNSLIVADNRPVSGDIDLIVNLPEGRTGTIERTLLMDMLQKQLDLSVPEEMLPEIVEYVQMGAKLTVEGYKIRLTSAKGPAGPALITVKLYGIDVPVLGQVDKTFDIEPLVKQARDRAQDKVRTIRGKLRK